MQINDLKLREARPSDRPHLLFWDTPNDLELKQLALYENAECISYRNNLISRTPATSRFLKLHLHLPRELEAIKNVCTEVSKPVVLISDLDCLITYIYTEPDTKVTFFWKNLETTRHLQSILWIILPRKLAPVDWDESRIKYI
ncbi:hypothetical protein NIES4071_83650 [Calothrix sp. NIES-4071]|nr:hypothetical protein NIES4071_83650 [Calothrix sp. NIES-4071]BAZ62633.1 hypothetical protein NIES4105_83580 [Calothrix sp. NIES-4105]